MREYCVTKGEALDPVTLPGQYGGLPWSIFGDVQPAPVVGDLGDDLQAVESFGPGGGDAAKQVHVLCLGWGARLEDWARRPQGLCRVGVDLRIVSPDPFDRSEAPPNRAPVFTKPPPLIRDDAPIGTLLFVVPKSEATPSSFQATPQPHALVSLYTNAHIRWVTRELFRFLHHHGCRSHDRVT